MSVLTSLGILILALCACGFLQLAPGIFLSFYHYASAQNSRDKVLSLSSFFIVGNILMTVLIFALTYFALFFFLVDNPTFDMRIFYWTLAGILLLIGLFVFCFYYRRAGEATELFISRRFAKSILEKTRYAKKPSDIFTLGMAAGLPEILFALPVYVVVVLEMLNFPNDNLIYQTLIILAFIVFSMFPMFSIRGHFYRGRKNLADIERARAKNKFYYRLILGASYILLAIFIVIFRIYV